MESKPMVNSNLLKKSLHKQTTNYHLSEKIIEFIKNTKNCDKESNICDKNNWESY